MAMTTRQMLERVKLELEAITPQIGRIYARLQFSPDGDQVITDWKFKDPTLGEIIKVFMIVPGNGKEKRGTTGHVGFSLAAQNIDIIGMISMTLEGKDAPDLVLEDTFTTITDKLRKLSRMQAASEGDAFFTGEMDWTKIGAATVASHKVLVKTLTIAVQDRRLGNT